MRRGCSDPAGVGRDGIELQLDASGVTIYNGRRDTIYIIASERQIAARIDWLLCTVPAECTNRVAPGAMRRLEEVSIPGWGESNEVIVWWWHLVPASGGGFRPDSVRAVVVRAGK